MHNAGKVGFCLLFRQAPCAPSIIIIMRNISSLKSAMLAFLHIFGLLLVVSASRLSTGAGSGVFPESLAEEPIGRALASAFDQGSPQSGRAPYVVTAIDTLGSRPPTCRNKCQSCVPCEAIQVPTNLKNNVQYSNYEPEGWKCRCRNKIFNP